MRSAYLALIVDLIFLSARLREEQRSFIDKREVEEMGVRTVVLSQVNYSYGENVFVPYSVGSLIAYAKSIPEICEAYQFQNPFFLRSSPSHVLNQIEEPVVLGLSCYLWNWEYNKALALAVRKAYPNTLIVMGGPQVPDNSQNFFKEHPYVDILVHQEGEIAFAEILKELLKNRPDYTHIYGLSVRVVGDRCMKTSESGNRILDLSMLPSPYVSGVFDYLLNTEYLLSAIWETVRGCPFPCNFCDWGSLTQNKVPGYPRDRVLADIEWFCKNKVYYLFNADANYGMFERDVEYADILVEMRARYGGQFPEKIRLNNAKNSDARVFRISQIFNRAGMNKGATLSFQSTDPTVLKNIQRENIPIQQFRNLLALYQKEGIATYTELITSLAGETYESSVRGIELLLEGNEEALNLFVYPCAVFPNAPMNTPEYFAKHAIKTVRMPLPFTHGTPETDAESIPEWCDVVVETKTVSREDWIRTWRMYWAVQTLHCLGLLRRVAIFFHREYGAGYARFYEQLLSRFTGTRDTVLGREIGFVEKTLRGSLDGTGGRLDLVDERFGNVLWPIEELAFLRIMVDKERFYQEIKEFVLMFVESLGSKGGSALVEGLVTYQGAIVIDPYSLKKELLLTHSFHDYFVAGTPLTEKSTRIDIVADVDYAGDWPEYAKMVVWRGRKGKGFYYPQIVSK